MGNHIHQFRQNSMYVKETSTYILKKALVSHLKRPFIGTQCVDKSGSYSIFGSRYSYPKHNLCVNVIGTIGVVFAAIRSLKGRSLPDCLKGPILYAPLLKNHPNKVGLFNSVWLQLIDLAFPSRRGDL